MNSLIGRLDYFRASCLAVVLRPYVLRDLYRNCASRLAIGYLLTLAVYLPLSLIRPDIVLLSGPLIFGYPHIIASLRYIQEKQLYLGKLRASIFFAFFTVICIIGHLWGFGLSSITELPFGVWQLQVATAALLITNYFTRQFRFNEILLTLLVTFGLMCVAYSEPIMFIGGMLILHNWVGYVYWMMASKRMDRRLVALASLMLFLVIHLLVISGYTDSFFPQTHNQVIFPADTMTTGWYLASWSKDSVVWYRWLVLYAFGLSMHYYVWLKAIPQSLNPFEPARNLRQGYKFLAADIGPMTTKVFILISALGIGVWLFSFQLGSKIYFEVAILHGALELLFMSAKIMKNSFNLFNHHGLSSHEVAASTRIHRPLLK